MKGLSLQTGMPLGGLFSSAPGYDPFEDAGYLRGSLSPTELTAPADSPTVITNYSTVAYVHTPTKLYSYLRQSPYTQTDKTASINVSAPVCGATIWGKGSSLKYIYSQASDLRAWDFASSDIQILNGSITGGGQTNRKLIVGPDLNLYMCDNESIAKCTTNASTSGNSLSAFLIDPGYTARDIVSDGRYLIILADNNAIPIANRVVGTYKCRVYFWDMSKTTADVIWDIDDSYLIGGAYLDGAVYVFGYSGLHVCNFSTAPKQILDIRGSSATITAWPANPFQISKGSNAIYWGDGRTNGQSIMAYGSMPGMKNKIFYCPYLTHGSTYAHTAIAYSAGAIFAGVNAPKLFLNNVGTTRGSTSVATVSIVLPQSYSLDFIKVSLKNPLASGQAVATSARNASGDVISDTATQTYSASNPRKNLIFPVKAATNSNSVFEDISLTINPQSGASVSRVSVYATPNDDANAML